MSIVVCKFSVKTKVHGLRFGEGLGVKRIGKLGNVGNYFAVSLFN